MPCDGCNDEKSYDMKFIGWKDGKLIPTAPSGYSQGDIQHQPLHMADLPYWVLDGEIPNLVIPKTEYKDSVFEEEIFVPEEVPEVPEVDDQLSHELKLKSMVAEDAARGLDVGEPLSKLTVDELRDKLKELNVEVKSYWRKSDLIGRLEMASSPQ